MSNLEKAEEIAEGLRQEPCNLFESGLAVIPGIQPRLAIDLPSTS